MASDTDLNVRRTFLAYDRTLMAWIRTSVSLISFGFTIHKFFDYLKASGGHPSRESVIGPCESAIGMISVAALAAATFQYRFSVRLLEQDGRHEYCSLTLMLGASVVMMGLALLAVVLLHL